MRKILVIVLAVILTVSLSLTSVAFAGGRSEVTVAQEAGQAWLDRTVELTGRPLDWVGAQLTAPQVCYGLDRQPKAYMFGMVNDGEVVGYIIVGSSAYGYAMFEAADVPPPSIPTSDKIKSILQRDLGLKVEEIGEPTRLLHLGFDNLFAVYRAGQQDVAVNLFFDYAVWASDLKTAMPSPEEYKARKEATEQSKPELLGDSGYDSLSYPPYGYNMLEMEEYHHEDTGRIYCGPCSGTSIGWYYREERGYDRLPLKPLMYDWLVYYWGKSHPIWPGEYGPGFIDVTERYGYDNFSWQTDSVVTGADYWNRVNDINMLFPVAIFSLNFYYPTPPDLDQPHWVAMRGYEWPHYEQDYGWMEHAIACTDSWRRADELWLDFDHLGWFIVTVTIKDR